MRIIVKAITLPTTPQKTNGSYIKRVPTSVLTSKKPYPYILGGEIENIDNLEEKMPTKESEQFAKVVFKPFVVRYLFSMPFQGIMNAAFPEQVYRPPA